MSGAPVVHDVEKRHNAVEIRSRTSVEPTRNIDTLSFSTEFATLRLIRNTASGIVLSGRLPKSPYPEDTAVFIPSGYDPKKPTRLLFYFAGHIVEGDFENQVISKRFEEQLSKQGHSNTILVAPKTRGQCTTFDTHFRGSKEFNNYAEATKRALEAQLNTSATSYSILAHSGGGRTVERIIKTATPGELRHLRQILMADATYGQKDLQSAPKLKSFLSHHPKVTVSVWYIVGHSTETKATRWATVDTTRVNIHPTSAPPRMSGKQAAVAHTALHMRAPLEVIKLLHSRTSDNLD